MNVKRPSNLFLGKNRGLLPPINWRLSLSWQFIALWVLIFVAMLSLLYNFGLVPRGVAEIGDGIISAASERGNYVNTSFSSTTVQVGPRIIVPKIGVNASVVFPDNTDIAILNNALTKGVVHYPSSALPGQNGNVFLFGHSTGLKVVNNKSYAVFNRLAELKTGDVIRLHYEDGEYWYKVSSTKIKKADEAWVDFNPGASRRLTLSTCRIFGAKEERYIVEAEFVKSYPLQNLSFAADTSS